MSLNEETETITSSNSGDIDSRMNSYNLFVKNNSQNVSNSKIKELFEKHFGEVDKIVMTKKDNFFVYFKNWEHNDFTLKIQKQILLSETFYIRESNIDFECQHIIPQIKTDINEILSIFIQNTKDFSKTDLKNALEKDYGFVRKIDMKKDKKGSPCAFVHFNKWYTTTFASFVQSGLENNQSFTLSLSPESSKEECFILKFYRNFSKSNISSPKNNHSNSNPIKNNLSNFPTFVSSPYSNVPHLGETLYSPKSHNVPYPVTNSPQQISRLAPIQTSFSNPNLDNEATRFTRPYYISSNQQKYKLFEALRNTNDHLQYIIKENNQILLECQYET
jgi:hypothetical protein